MSKQPTLARRIAERYWGGDALGPNTIVDVYAEEIQQMFRDDRELIAIQNVLKTFENTIVPGGKMPAQTALMALERLIGSVP